MKNILLDTDISGDCDDAGALAVLHSFANRGEARLLACVVNGRDRDASSGAVVWAINSYYGRGDIPIGTYHGEAERTNSCYTLAIRQRFAPDYPLDMELPSALGVSRRALAAAEDGSVTILSIGFLHNLRDLIESGPDDSSSCSGVALVRRKVKELILMGGAFPTSLNTEPEYNFAWGGVAPITSAVLEKWPTPIIFSGFELGRAVITGTGLAKTPPHNPVRMAYSLYPVESGYALEGGRYSWDQTVAWIGVRGVDGLWNLSEPGICRVLNDGHNEWKPAEDGAHYYIKEALPAETVAGLIEVEMAALPQVAG